MAFIAGIFGLFSTVPAQAQQPSATPLKLPTITITIPKITVTNIVTVTKTKIEVRPTGRVTTIRPPAVTLPRRTQTVRSVVRVPQPAKTVVQSRTVVKEVTPPPVTRTVTAKPSTTTVTPPAVTRTVEGPEVVKLTTSEAAGASLALVLVGAILGVLIIIAMYALGYFDADRKNKEFLEDMIDKAHLSS